MEKRMIYFYKDKLQYVLRVTSLYLGMSLFTLINISFLGQIAVMISSLLFTGGVIQFVVRKKQTLQTTACIMFLCFIMLSINFYSHLLSNSAMYPFYFMFLHLLGVIGFCVLYSKALCVQKKSYVASCWLLMCLFLLLLLGYLLLGRGLSFWHSSAVTFFTMVQIVGISPMSLLFFDVKAFSQRCQLLNYSLFTGKFMTVYSVFVFMLLLIWDIFLVVIVYNDII